MTLSLYISQLQDLKKRVGSGLLNIGKILNEIKEQKLYVEQCTTFEEFLAIPELSFHRATAYKAMKIAKVFSLILEDVSDIDPDKLYLISGKVEEEPAMAEELIGKARSLSRSDLRAELGRETHEKLSPEKDIEAFLDFVFLPDYLPSEFKGMKFKQIEWAGKLKKLIREWEKW